MRKYGQKGREVKEIDEKREKPNFLYYLLV